MISHLIEVALTVKTQLLVEAAKPISATPVTVCPLFTISSKAVRPDEASAKPAAILDLAW
ncbi:hypothetical protein D3C85_1694260 [compost metagenome]